MRKTPPDRHDAAGKATEWQAAESAAPYRAKLRMRLEKRNRSLEPCDEVSRKLCRGLPCVEHRTIDKLIGGKRMSRENHRMASRARAMAISTGTATAEPPSNSARRRSASADQAASISVSGPRLASSLSAKFARSSGESRNACASTSAMDVEIVHSDQDLDKDDRRLGGLRGPTDSAHLTPGRC
jgi:hypothetical protein